MKYTPYSEEELVLKQRYYKNLPERQRRHFLALEYNSLGRGSQRYIAKVFECCRKTIIKGGKELLDLGPMLWITSVSADLEEGEKKRDVSS